MESEAKRISVSLPTWKEGCIVLTSTRIIHCEDCAMPDDVFYDIHDAHVCRCRGVMPTIWNGPTQHTAGSRPLRDDLVPDARQGTQRHILEKLHPAPLASPKLTPVREVRRISISLLASCAPHATIKHDGYLHMERPPRREILAFRGGCQERVLRFDVQPRRNAWHSTRQPECESCCGCQVAVRFAQQRVSHFSAILSIKMAFVANAPSGATTSPSELQGTGEPVPKRKAGQTPVPCNIRAYTVSSSNQ